MVGTPSRCGPRFAVRCLAPCCVSASRSQGNSAWPWSTAIPSRRLLGGHFRSVPCGSSWASSWPPLSCWSRVVPRQGLHRLPSWLFSSKNIGWFVAHRMAGGAGWAPIVLNGRLRI